MHKLGILEQCIELKSTNSEISDEKSISIIDNLNRSDSADLFINKFESIVEVFDSVCPHCYSEAEEKTIGGEGNTYCTENCGNIENEGSIEIFVYHFFKVAYLPKSNKWIKIPSLLI